MNWTTMALIAALIVLIFWFERLFGRTGKVYRRSYQKHSAIFSADDRVFFHALKAAVDGEYEIFGKIRVGDVVIPKQGRSRDGKGNAFNAIDGRHFDFVLCDLRTLAVVCAIQLHDKANPAAQAEPDPLLPVCENLGLPLVRFQVKAEYSIHEISDRVHKTMAREPLCLVETGGRKEPRISSIEDIKF